jgi:hypothetical protein
MKKYFPCKWKTEHSRDAVHILGEIMFKDKNCKTIMKDKERWQTWSFLMRTWWMWRVWVTKNWLYSKERKESEIIKVTEQRGSHEETQSYTAKCKKQSVAPTPSHWVGGWNTQLHGKSNNLDKNRLKSIASV